MNNTVSKRFSAAAATYDRHASLQTATARRVMALLPEQCRRESVLDVGCGTGILTEMVHAELPAALIDALDVSEEMVEMTRARFEKATGAHYVVSDFVHYTPGKSYDLIVSNAALHWIHPLESAFKKANEILSDDGAMICSVMLGDTFSELRAARARIAPDKAVTVTLPTYRDVTDALQAADLDVEVLEHEHLRVNCESAAALLRLINEQGLSGGAVSRSAGALTRGEIRKLEADYDAEYRDEAGGVYATYEVAYISAVRRSS